MRRKYRCSAELALALFLLGVVFWGGFNTAMEATNTLPFCISCHEMRDNVYREYRGSVHEANASGVRAACPDCHVPRAWFPKVVRKIQASQELFHWALGTIDTREKFLARRAHLAGQVWAVMKSTDSRECRNCHDFHSMKLGEQGRFAADRHRRALRAGATCIDCHQGISHHLPSPPPLLAEKDYDPEEAEDIMEVCAGCHGDKGQGAPDGEYPRLAGLNAHYIARQLRHFKSHERINIPMIPYANERELPEPDVRTIATYLSRIELPTKLEPIEENEIGEGFDALARLEASKAVLNIPRYPGNVEAGGRLYRKECAGCHGLDGRGRVGRIGDRVWVVPTLVGQHSNYLLRQIRKFRKGERRHDRPEDAAIFRRFSDAEIGDLLAWLSVQDD